MAEHERIEELTESIKQYTSTSCELIKLEVVERTSVIGSGVISGILITVVGFLFLLFLSLGAGFYFSSLFGDNYSGFALVAGFYLLAGLILLVGRKKLMERPIRDRIIRKVFSKN